MNEEIESLVAIIGAQKKQIATPYQDAIEHGCDYKTFWVMGEALWRVLAPMQNRRFVPLAEINVGEAVYRMAVDRVYGTETAATPLPQAPEVSHFERYINNLREKHNTEVGLEDAEHTKEDVEKVWVSIMNPPSLNQENDDNDTPTIDLDEERRRRGKVFGLVVGRVQSGKTRNYTGLLLKAFDEGWNTVIVLTSDKTTLADQTMERIQNECNDVGLYITPIDFGERRASDIRFNAAGKYIGMAQKNVNHLRNIEQWLERIAEADRENVSLLVIDDESDNATPDTQQSSLYVLTEADIDYIALNFPSRDDPAVRHVSEWIRSLGGLDAPSRAVELGMANDVATADAVVDAAAQEVAKATMPAAMVELLRKRGSKVAKILGIDKEVDVGNGQLRWLDELIVEKMNNKRSRRHQYDNNRILSSLVQYVFEVRVARSRINHLVATMFSNGGNIGGSDKYQFGKMAYVSYTATPFANVLNENPKLDPLASDFIYPMQTSRHYIGLSRMFGKPRKRHDKSVNMGIVREISDAEMSIVSAVQEDAENLKVTDDLTVSWKDADPDNPENFIQCCEEWQSLRDAVVWLFCSASARRFHRIRIHPGSRKLAHRWTTMLFNIGIDQGLHMRLKDDVVVPYLKWIEGHQAEFIESCQRLWCGEDDDGNVRSDGRPTDFTLVDFNQACDGYGEIENYPLWSEIAEHLHWFVNAHMVGNVHCEVANGSEDGMQGMRKYRDVDESRSHDSDDHIWILCGGYTMSRGLTLDGLVVSYVDRMRKGSAVDTLIQIGRWFGYREGYELLPRVWMSGASMEEYKKMAFTEEALHHDLKHNFDTGFSPKSGDHYARVIKFSRRLSGRSVAETQLGRVGSSFDVYRAFWPERRRDVIDCVRRFAADTLGLENQLQRPIDEYRAQGDRRHRYHTYPYWRGVDGEAVSQFLREYAEYAPGEVQIAARALQDEIRAVPQKWDVVFSNAQPKGVGRDEAFPICGEDLRLMMSNTPCTGVFNGCFEFKQYSGDEQAFFSGVKTSAIVQGEIGLVKSAMKEGVVPPEGWDGGSIRELFANREANGFQEPLPPEIRRAFSFARMTRKDYRTEVFKHVERTDCFFDGPNPILQISLVRPPSGKGLVDENTPFVAVSFYWPNHDDTHYTYVAAGDVENSMDADGSLAVDKMRVEIDKWLNAFGFLAKETLREFIKERFGWEAVNDTNLNIALNDGRGRYAAVNPVPNAYIECRLNKSTLYSQSWLSEIDMPGASVSECVCRRLEAEAYNVMMSNGGFAEFNNGLYDLMRREYPYHLKCVNGSIDDLFIDMEAKQYLSCFHIGTRDQDGVQGWKAYEIMPSEIRNVRVGVGGGELAPEDDEWFYKWWLDRCAEACPNDETTELEMRD